MAQPPFPLYAREAVARQIVAQPAVIATDAGKSRGLVFADPFRLFHERPGDGEGAGEDEAGSVRQKGASSPDESERELGGEDPLGKGLPAPAGEVIHVDPTEAESDQNDGAGCPVSVTNAA